MDALSHGIGVQGVDSHRRAGPLAQFRRAAKVVSVPVGDQDQADGVGGNAVFRQPLQDAVCFSRIAGVHQHATRVPPNQKGIGKLACVNLNDGLSHRITPFQHAPIALAQAPEPENGVMHGPFYFTTLPTKVNPLTTGLIWDMMEL